MSNSNKRILFTLSGSIACFKAAAAISKLVQAGFEIRCVFTAGAKQFIGKATLEGLTRHKVYDDTFESGEALSHIELVRWADFSVVCPASAGIISRFAHGQASDLASTLFLAQTDLSRCLVFPAMNPAMYQHPAVRENLSKLASWGVQIVDASSGRTACGEEGVGRLPEPEEIVARIQKRFNESPAVRARVLITSGGTSEPIDDVRVISNRSTGSTAAQIATEFSRAGYEVTYLHSATAAKPVADTRSISFNTFADLEHELRRALHTTSYDLVIHAAAVSDYSPAERQIGKLSSEPEELLLRLKRNPKLATHLREWSQNKSARIVLFKLAPRAERDAAVTRLFETSQPDIVIYNSPEAIASGEQHETEVYVRGQREPTRLTTKSQLASTLINTAKEYLK